MLKRTSIFSLVDRYIMAQLVSPFFFGLGIFTGLGLTIGVLFDVMRKLAANDITWVIAAQILALRLPEYLVLGLPMAILLGSLAAYSNLSTFSEIIALRSAGLSPIRLMLPCLLGGLLVTGLTFSLNDWIVPQTTREATTIIETALGGDHSNFQKNNIIYPEYHRVETASGNRQEVLKTLFYAEKFDGQEMTQLTILDRSNLNASRIITARSGQWQKEQEQWEIRNGSVYQIDKT